MKVKEIGGTQFPVEEATENQVVIGRTKDDLIMVVMPPGVMAVTFMLMANNHFKLTCDFVSSLGYHMRNDDVKKSEVVSDQILDIVIESVLRRHNITAFEEGMFKKGTPDLFDGLYYGEFTPTELAAVGQVMQEIRSTSPAIIRSLPTIANVVDLWTTATERFVSSAELLAAVQWDGAVGGSA